MYRNDYCYNHDNNKESFESGALITPVNFALKSQFCLFSEWMLKKITSIDGYLT